VIFTKGPSSPDLIDCLDLAMKFSSVKSYSMKEIVYSTLKSDQHMNITEF